MALPTSQPQIVAAQPILLTVDQAAEVLNIGRDLAWQLVHSGQLPSIKFSPRVIRISRRVLERWVEERAAGTTSPGSVVFAGQSTPQHRP